MRPTLAVTIVLGFTPLLAAAEPFRFRAGDRVVLIGGTLIEREQKYGYWETALTAAFPDANVTFRNLGWSGDTVWGESRAGFDTPKEGYKRLIEQTLALKPTVIIIGYGSNESFAGPRGLSAFREQFNKLLNDLAPANPRFILLAPMLLDETRRTQGDPDGRAADISAYAAVIRDIAQGRQAYFVEDYRPHRYHDHSTTDDGLHFTALGYRLSADRLLGALQCRRLVRPIDLDGVIPRRDLQPYLVAPPYPSQTPDGFLPPDCTIRARSLVPSFDYMLKIDGRRTLSADAAAWTGDGKKSLVVPQGPSLDQAEQLRRAIVEKNRQFFYRWRPQNETYLFGFRRHEQGQNAQEIPRFDPIVEKLEQEIARLRVPVEHIYELTPARQ